MASPVASSNNKLSPSDINVNGHSGSFQTPTSLSPTGFTQTTSGSSSSRTNPRKSSAERSINHTRMTTDEDIQKEYTYDVIVGEGSFGKVYRARHNATGETVAIKEIVKEKAGSSGIRQLDQEVSIFKKVDHQNIIKLNEVIESPKKTYLIMELCEGGDLAQLLQKRSHLSEADTKVVMKSLAEAIKYLHQQGILHRDLKLENILLSEDADKNNPIRIKVSDFGLSTQLNNNSFENMKEEYCGTPVYMAPEMNSTYSYLVDVWAMGIIMYYLLTEYPKDNLLNESIKTEGPQFKEPQWAVVSDPAKDLLREILTQDPAHRISSGEVLNHEWFTGEKRQHPNVLKMMKEFRQEQEEERTAKIDENMNSAINGIGELQAGDSAIDGTNGTTANGSGKKEVRKGSGGKKSTSGDRSALTPPSSSKPTQRLKPGGSSSVANSPRVASKPSDKHVTNRATTVTGKTTTSSNSHPNTTTSKVNKPTTQTQKVKKK